MGIRLGSQATARLLVPKRKDRRHVHVGAGRLERYAALFEDIGLTTRSALIRSALEIADRISVDGAAARQRLEGRRSELVGEVAGGERGVEDAAVALEDAKRAEATAPVANEVARSARAKVLSKAVSFLYDSEAELMADLDGVVKAATEKLRRAAEAAEGVATDADAIRAPLKVRNAWASMVEQRRQIEQAWRVSDMLRLDGLIHDLPAPSPPSEEWRFRKPAAFRATRSKDATVRLALAIEAGAEPAVLTAEQLGESFKAAS